MGPLTAVSDGAPGPWRMLGRMPADPVPLRALLLRALGIVLPLLAAVLAGRLVPAVPALAALDDHLLGALAVHGGTVPAALALALDAALSPAPAAAITLVLAAAVALARRRPAAGLRILALVALPWAGAKLVKLLVGRPRPEADPLAALLVPMPGSSSFPSGHTAVAAALGVALLLAVPAGRARALLAAPVAVLALATAWSRVALGVHRPTDVLASLVLVPALALLLDGMLRRAQAVEAAERS